MRKIDLTFKHFAPRRFWVGCASWRPFLEVRSPQGM
jgi:hypothetical protein